MHLNYPQIQIFVTLLSFAEIAEINTGLRKYITLRHISCTASDELPVYIIICVTMIHYIYEHQSLNETLTILYQWLSHNPAAVSPVSVRSVS